MKVSVVIPTLNERDNLPGCLENLIPQLSEGDEVVVVDGGSDDGTQKIASKAGCKVIEAENSSIGAARNIGTEHSSNEVIISLDADSLPPDGWVQRIRNHFATDDELVVLWGDIRDKNGVPIRNLVGKFSTFFRGASGNNTAFRKSAYEDLDVGYPDVSFMEDFVVIERLSTKGKAVRDEGLIMVMNMDRERYQTVPLTGLSLASLAIGAKAGGKWEEYGTGFALGTMGTEIVYEQMSEGYIHHDEVGAIIFAASQLVSGEGSGIISGMGVGTMAHHALTEGLSALPTLLQQNTDMVIENER